MIDRKNADRDGMIRSAARSTGGPPRLRRGDQVADRHRDDGNNSGAVGHRRALVSTGAAARIRRDSAQERRTGAT